jgi:hypothetical protein
MILLLLVDGYVTPNSHKRSLLVLRGSKLLFSRIYFLTNNITIITYFFPAYPESC